MDKALEILLQNLTNLIGEGKRFENESVFARACGIPQRTINRIRRREQDLTVEKLGQLAHGIGVTVSALFVPGMNETDEDFAMLRRLNVKASAGNGNLVFFESERGRLAFRRDFLRTAGVKEDEAVVIYADGQSMEPTIPDGAVLLVDTARTELANNDVYVIRLDSEILVKRLRKEIGGGVLIVSDNPDKHKYPDILVSPDKEDHLSIIGRVFWMGARL
ncbi:S24 family peptidase [Cupriavidus campinensis]|uniref:Helix-turn-helix transcriptional regulator n=1 Tax=Cupriavidus campinensis TaxID=151783 RepID=A0ABY3EKI8_9BURK|nr:S24 family peptidase [Cupriavidus campinensis]TSP11459.1 helix-turn-helix transcriptional regulator [Cupriavidus campinensis]